ncbi:MAG: lipase family protein [Selenomonadaceae bacterium]|nr:lipase family protein [Selenomonadaceae bacterium]
MKKLVLLLLLTILSFGTASAADFETEREQLICALSATAAYSDETGDLSRRFLAARGWEIEKLESPSEKINVKIHFMGGVDSAGNVTKILFVTGTEDLKDVGVDVKVKSVPFKENDENILVHRGFRDYADAALSEGILDFFVEYIDNHPNENFYITGHSLGGAISMLIAARLADAGADMSRIKVVTFGAPAVGNKAFAETYQDKINLTRVVMDSDPVDVSLKLFGYAHFGEVVNYKQVESSTQYSHSMALYLDTALRKFYDAELEIKSQEKVTTPVFIAPIKIVQKSFAQVNEDYVKSILRDGYKSRFSNITFAEPNFAEIKKAEDFSYSVREYVDAAKKSGCKFIIAPLIHTKPVKESKQRATRVLVEEIVFDSNGNMLSMNTAGMTTTDVTILDAAFWGQEFLREDREKTVTEK